MEWFSQKLDFLKSDLRLFEFSSEGSFRIRTVRLQKTDRNPDVSDHTTEDAFLAWLALEESSLELPGLVLVMHQRLDAIDPHGAKALPYAESTFKILARRLYQHRSLSFLLKRASTAVFNCRSVSWEGSLASMPSIVYNCKSDIESPPPHVRNPNDVALAVTSFPTIGTAYAVMYGCTQPIIDLVSKYLKGFGGQALHPLVMPMIFAEIERKRLFDLLDVEKTTLRRRILDLENKLRGEAQGSISEKGDTEPFSSTRDCESTKLWIDVSSLKNGLESLMVQLQNLIEHSGNLATTQFKPPVDGSHEVDKYIEERRTGSRIVMRLREMVDELGSKIRSCQGLLGGMSLAAQMESNYYTRRDARVSIYIANATQKDGSQMRSISLLGMIFLPGTFLASLFSMSFFNWTPPDGNQIISPWIALYGVLAIVITLVTVWRMRKWMDAEERKARDQMRKEVYSDGDSFA
ncbi:hypothetical protein CORC01_08664 [Colletotrichum orchidophilum]|uniref:CorA-like Mg2+ transporter n=1 Tax=Colletotrichum orchidophilum TaxID=1209926 RepID=A0A1G4B3I9_9PEZI|nr:uncharacterized protein CORC01_08664 [Colletotrichum orchidophilum]OHE95971.1 hypothetical protein CORC01_08664 [Colletotrichum orchidophilum]